MTPRENYAAFANKAPEFIEAEYPFEVHLPDYHWRSEGPILVWLNTHMRNRFDYLFHVQRDTPSSIEESIYVWFKKREHAVLFKLTWASTR